MSLGPLQLIVIGFDNPEPDGSVLAELNAVRDQGFIRLVDALGVYKDQDGAIWSAEVSDLSEDETLLAGAAIGAFIAAGAAGAEVPLELDADTAASIVADVAAEGALAGAERAAEVYEFGMDPEAVQNIADQIPPGGGALLMLIEHTWLVPLRDAIRRQGGIILAQEFLSPEALLAMGAEMAVAEQMTAALNEG